MIYFDNAATTRASETTVETVSEYLREKFYNPSSLYHEGIEAKRDLDKARSTILETLCADGKVIFTGGGTESDNIALFGSKKHKNGRIILGGAEHAAIYASAAELKQRGYDVVLAPVDSSGRVIAERFEELLTPEVTLVSVMHVNNETGAVNDVAALAESVKHVAPKAIFHSDGVQAFGKMKLNLRSTAIDLYSLSAHKLGAPKGLGALYIRSGVSVSPIVFGGGQEGGLRSSTENTAAIAAFRKAAEERYGDLDATRAAVSAIRARIIEVLGSIEEIKILSPENGSPYILTFSSRKVRGEVMQHALEREGVLIGTGSACSSNKASERIPEALGLKDKYRDGIVRLSFFKDNTLSEADEFAGKYLKVYKELSKYGS